MNKAQSLSGTAVAIGDNGVLIIGASGSGKSDIALRLIDRGAQLIADDLITITGEKDNPILRQTAHHIDAIEIRGVGIIPMQCVNNISLKLIVQLNDNYERNPSPLPLISYDSYTIPCIKIFPFEISAPIKIEQAIINFKHLINSVNAH